MRALGVLGITSVIAVAAASAANGCGGDSGSTAPPPLATGSGHPPEPAEDAASEGSTPPADAAPNDAGGPATRRFTGTLVASPPASFGGSPYCSYKMTLKQIDIDLTLNEAGLATSGLVKDIAFEEAVPPCPNAAMAATMNEYSLARSSKLATGALHVELTGFAQNRPSTTLVVEGIFTTDHVSAVAEWHRTDQNPPLDWRVKATVPLDRR